MTENIDIVIPCRLTKQWGETYACFDRCLGNLKMHTKHYRIIFVDDHSDFDGATAISNAALMLPDSLIVRTHKQRWFTRAVNLGLRMIRTPWCVVLNSDAFVQPGWLDELWEGVKFYKETNVGLIGSVYSPQDPRRFMPTQPPNYVTGHCWLLNMQALYDVSAKRGTPGIYLDETVAKTIHIFSDNFLCYAMNEIGYATIVSHHSHVDHVAGKSWGQLLGLIPNDLRIVNDVY